MNNFCFTVVLLNLSKILTIDFNKQTPQKMKFSTEDFFSKCDQIRSFLQIWSNLLKKSSMENLIFCAVKNKLQVCSANVVSRLFKSQRKNEYK